jgi:ribosomal protein L32E
MLPELQSEAENRRIDHTVAQRKRTTIGVKCEENVKK